jgi:hypothetical protein
MRKKYSNFRVAGKMGEKFHRGFRFQCSDSGFEAVLARLKPETRLRGRSR